MRDADFNVCQTSQGLETEANSLCRKILPVSPCTSRFWRSSAISKTGKSFISQILAGKPQKSRFMPTPPPMPIRHGRSQITSRRVGRSAPGFSPLNGV